MWEAALVLSALLVALVAGLLFAFAVVAMPGLEALDDRQFLRAFKVMDRVIQDNQPLFMVVWAGSVVVLVGSAVVGLGRLEGLELALLLSATALYLIGVQLPTVLVNIPLNNRVQAIDLDTADDEVVAGARHIFEARWNRWNRIRAAVAVLVTALLLTLLARL